MEMVRRVASGKGGEGATAELRKQIEDAEKKGKGLDLMGLQVDALTRIANMLTQVVGLVGRIAGSNIIRWTGSRTSAKAKNAAKQGAKLTAAVALAPLGLGALAYQALDDAE
jgi:hypothetical protein